MQTLRGPDKHENLGMQKPRGPDNNQQNEENSGCKNPGPMAVLSVLLSLLLKPLEAPRTFVCSRNLQ